MNFVKMVSDKIEEVESVHKQLLAKREELRKQIASLEERIVHAGGRYGALCELRDALCDQDGREQEQKVLQSIDVGSITADTSDPEE